MLMLCATALSSCNKEYEHEEGLITVLRFTENLSAGKRITSAKVQELTVFTSDVPTGTLSITLEELTNNTYYTSEQVFAGDFLTESRASTEKPSNDVLDDKDNSYEGYVVAKPSKSDCYDTLQKLINDNLGKTIYFPDGTYNISKPLVVPTAPENRVSLKLSQYAVIAVNNSDSWNLGDPVIHFGADESYKEDDSESVGSRAFITGGTINAKNVATGIKIEGMGNVTVHHMAIKNAVTGIHILTNNVHVDSITGTGNSTINSIGILVEGSYNILSNFRMCQIHYGIKLTKGQNVLRNIHPLISTMRDSQKSIGFWDLSEGNFYDYCYSDQFAIAFKVADGNSSVFTGCESYWWSPDNKIHYGFYVDGKFDGVINTTRIVMCHPKEADNAYIVVKTPGGDGKIVNPLLSIVDEAPVQDDHANDFNKYLADQ